MQKFMEHYSEFVEFMTKYADFFDEVMKREDEKFKALCSRDTKRMDAAFTLHMETEEKITAIESERLELNKKAGCDGMTFTQIINALPREENAKKQELDGIFQRLRFSVEQTKILNQSSLEYAQMNLDIVDKINGVYTDSQYYNADGTQVNNTTRPNFLNKKV